MARVAGLNLGGDSLRRRAWSLPLPRNGRMALLLGCLLGGRILGEPFKVLKRESGSTGVRAGDGASAPPPDPELELYLENPGRLPQCSIKTLTLRGR